MKKHNPWVFSGFQTHSDRHRFGMETVRGGLGVSGCWAEAVKISTIPAGAGRVGFKVCVYGTGAEESQPTQDSNAYMRGVTAI